MTSNTLGYIIKYLGILCTFFALIGISYQLISYRNNPEKRTHTMRRFLYIFIGILICGNTLLISQFVYNTAQRLSDTVNDGNPIIEQTFDKNEDKGNFLSKLVAAFIDDISEWIIGNGEDKEGIAKKWLGFENLGDLFFEKTAINLNGGSKTESTIYGPLTKQEWDTCMSIYYVLVSLTIPFIIIMIGKTGIMYIYGSNSISKIEEVKEDTKRWVFIVILLACSPIIIKVFFTFIGSFSNSVFEKFSGLISGSPILGPSEHWQDINTGSFLVTAVVKFLYAGQYFMINAAFIARKWVLIVMVSVAPIIFGLWGINKKVHAFDIWMGEIITNGVMGICYGIVFIVISKFISGGANIIMIIIGMKMATQLAEVLRNSLQGFFTRMAGVNEMNSGIVGMTAAGGILAGAANLFGASKNKSVGETLKGVGDSFSSQMGGASKSSGSTTKVNGSGTSTAGSTGKTKASTITSNLGSNTDGIGTDPSSLGDAASSSLINDATKDNAIDDNMETTSSQLESDLQASANPITQKNLAPGVSGSEGVTSSANPITQRNLAPGVSGSEGVAASGQNEAIKEPDLTTTLGGEGALRGNKATDLLKTKIGANQEFSNVLARAYNNNRAKNFGNAIGTLATGGEAKLSGLNRGIATAANSAYNAVAMGKAIYQAGNHIASQRKGEKANMKESWSTAKEMLGTNKVIANQAENGSTTVDINRGSTASSIARGIRLVGATTIGDHERVSKVLVNNSMQQKLNNTYTDWSKIGTFTSNPNSSNSQNN